MRKVEIRKKKEEGIMVDECLDFLVEFDDSELEVCNESLRIPWGTMRVTELFFPMFQVQLPPFEAELRTHPIFLLSHDQKKFNGVSDRTEGTISLVYGYQKGSILGLARTGPDLFSGLSLPLTLLSTMSRCLG